jgi:hypothetical protein
MKRKYFLLGLILLFFNPLVQAQDNSADRKLWLNQLDKIARPVIFNLAQDELKAKMPVVLSNRIDNKEVRTQVSYLEAFGRTLSGIAPWLELEGGDLKEQALRNQYREWTLKAIANAVNPEAKDYLQWKGSQPLVDASFFSLALIRSPWLWNHLDKKVQQQVVDALIITRATIPVYSNWILFSGMIETFFCKYDLPYNPITIEFGIREFSEHWYTGDGLFSDGMNFHLDYYNSYVIQPYLNTILNVMKEKNKKNYVAFAGKFDQISKRYAEIQERLINTDGTFPVLGRSIAYRGGAFQHLADLSLRKNLPVSLSPAQVRCALTAVLKKTLASPSTFTKDGWLTIGLYGNQPDIAETYITTGSLYLCSEIFLPLGLPETDEFWSTAPQPWTAVKVWEGQDLKADHALEIH